ncbi:MAG: histidine phosphatase family protein [Spirochaetaceae bacterium]|nr:MAG: histidine phosphatase family protein [Spirochaetaceae bacterium]
MTLYLIRHAQSANNLLYDRTGSNIGRVEDPELTSLGIEQARILADYVAEHNGGEFRFTHLYSSLMVRAVATATAVARSCNLRVVAWPEVHEWMGIYLEDEQTGELIGRPGKSRSYFEKHYPDLLLPDSLNEHGWWNRPAEIEIEWKLRAAEFLAELRGRHGNGEDRVAVVTHGGFYHEVLSALTGGSGTNNANMPDRVWFTMHNTGITRIDFRPTHTAVIYHNRLEHLPPELAS